MAQEIMYPGIANSPQTELASSIDDTQTTIPLVDASKLPDGPNIAVLGNGEDAETVIYTAKSGNDLTGVTRGVEGEAKSWPAGTKVARNFTNRDYEAIADNIRDLVAGLGDLAGAGRTDETVKGNADALTAHLAETVTDIANVKTGFGGDIQAAADSLINGGILYIPSGTYLIDKNVGVNDRWGIKITNSNVHIIAEAGTKFVRSTPLSETGNNPADAYPLLFIGVPDSNDEADQVRNITVSGIEFEGSDIRHTMSGSHPQDWRFSIALRGTKNVKIEGCSFSKIDSSAIFCKRVGYLDCKVKNYDLTVRKCSFSAVPHETVNRAFIHAIVLGGTDRAQVTENEFEWCDSCVAGETSYDKRGQSELDTYTDTKYGLGTVKRGGRGWKIHNNTIYNSSEHAVYISCVDATVTDNTLYTDRPDICIGDIKVRAKGCVIKGNTVVSGGVSVSISVPSSDITVDGNSLERILDSGAGCIDIDSVNINQFVVDRSDYLTHQQMRNFVISNNTAKSRLVSPTYDYAVRVYTDISPQSNYPYGTIGNVVISGNSFDGFRSGVIFFNDLVESYIIEGNIFAGKTFIKTAFDEHTVLGSYAVVVSHTVSVLSKGRFVNNHVEGFEYIFGSETGSPADNSLHMPWGMMGNTFNYIKNIKTAKFRGYNPYSQFHHNVGMFFLDRTFYSPEGNATGWSLFNALGDGTTSESYNKSGLQTVGSSDVRLYTDDNLTHIQLK